MFLVVEILHRFEIQQRVHRLGIGIGIGLVHLAAKGDAPARNRKGEPGIGHHHQKRGQRHPYVEDVEQHAAIDQHQEDGGEDAEQGEGQQRVDPLGAAFDHAAQAAGLALQMKAQRQSVDMRERLHRHFAHGVVLHLGENAVAQLGESLHHDARHRIGGDQRRNDRHRGTRGRGAEGIHRLTQELLRDGGSDDGQDQEENRNNDPDLQVGPSLGPQIGHQPPKRLEGRRAAAFFYRMRHVIGPGPRRQT